VVKSRAIRLGPVVDGLRIVAGSLTPADRVIVSGIPLAAPGAKVNVRLGRIAPQTPPPSAAAAIPAAAQATLASY
jgi:multidrug efflux system membrane fusion protein